MALHAQLKEELKESLKEKNKAKLRTVRSLLTAFTNELVATGKTPHDTLEDDAAMSVIKRAAKQRKESITQYAAAGRDDLVEPEEEELAILETYLPQMMSRDEILPIVEAKKAELNISNKSKTGVLVGAVMKECAGKADGADVKVVVESLFE